MTRDDVFRIIDEADARVLPDQLKQDGGVTRIEHVVPFVEDDFSLWVWAFYETDRDLQAALDCGASSGFQSLYVTALRECGYDSAWLNEVGFTFDSIENVDANYEGSFFYRLR
jgi:hypothetical protein